MKVIVLLVFIALAVATPPAVQFKKFMTKYGKSYDTNEYQHRLSIFRDNLVKIEEMNAKNPKAKFGVTKYADLTESEFRSQMLAPVPMDRFIDPSWPVAALKSVEEIEAMPASWDWRDHNAVTPVKNQGQCGSCWSFSATGSMEGQWAIAGNGLVGLSEQNLVDCDHHCMEYENQSSCDAGCDGGLMPNAFMYTIGNGGIDTESSYPYLGEDGTCQFNAKNVGAKMTSWTMVSNNETQMAAYLAAHGPLSIAVDAIAWQLYIGGVFEDPWCGTELDHGVLIVGYGTEIDWFGMSIDFWIVKNSWGEDWGESGYIRLERNAGECGDNIFPCTAIA